jgi:hypothetical protein
VGPSFQVRWPVQNTAEPPGVSGGRSVPLRACDREQMTVVGSDIEFRPGSLFTLSVSDAR